MFTPTHVVSRQGLLCCGMWEQRHDFLSGCARGEGSLSGDFNIWGGVGGVCGFGRASTGVWVLCGLGAWEGVVCFNIWVVVLGVWCGGGGVFELLHCVD